MYKSELISDIRATLHYCFSDDYPVTDKHIQDSAKLVLSIIERTHLVEPKIGFGLCQMMALSEISQNRKKKN